MRAVYVMWLRQLKRYWRSRGRMIGMLGQPLLFFLALGFGFGPIYEQARGEDFLQFLGPGVVAMTILFTSMFSGIEVIWDRQFGFLKETLVAPVRRIEIMIGKTLGGATVAMVQGLIVFALILAFGFRPESWAFFALALMFMLLIGLLFTGVGIAIASRLEDMQAFPIIMNFIIMPIFFLSGALFPLDNLPSTVDIITTINPLTYGVDGIRGALTFANHFTLLTDFLVLAAIMLAVFAIGSFLFSRAEA